MARPGAFAQVTESGQEDHPWLPSPWFPVRPLLSGSWRRNRSYLVIFSPSDMLHLPQSPFDEVES